MRQGMLSRLLVSVFAAATLTWAVAMPSIATQMPVTEASYATDAVPPHGALFGSSEVYSDNIASFTQWMSMLARSAAERQAARHPCTSRSETQCIPQEWQSLLERLRGLDLRHQIAIVNAALNRHPYVTTMHNWHRAMYWETAFEFLRYGGQCQDYAIAKYLLLRAAGVPAAAMRVIVLHDEAIGLDHALLAVYVDGEPLLLDNLRRDIVPARSVGYYRPYYSINEDGWWLHFGGQSMIRAADSYR